jgi:two-component sensor histidine kinase
LVSEVTHSQPGSGKVSCRVDVQEIALPVDQAIPCGLVINELVTNAFKHGFPEGRPGQVSVSIAESGADTIELVVADDGAGIPADVSFGRGGGFGLALVSMLADQLGATLEIERHPGTRIHARFPRRRV